MQTIAQTTVHAKIAGNHRTTTVHWGGELRRRVAAVPNKTERIEIRTTEHDNALIAEAAKLRELSVSAFISQAATAEASRVVARSRTVLMPADQFDELLHSLDVADSAPALTKVARRPRRFVRE